MKRLDRILVVVDPTTESQPALEKAARLARASAATLELFVCDFDPAFDGRGLTETDRLQALREQLLADRRATLEGLAGPLRRDGLEVETHASWDNPLHRGIVHRVRATSPDLVIKDTHYHSALRRALVTNADWNLIRTCPAPLLLVKPMRWPAAPRVIAAIDPGHPADEPAALEHDILDSASLLAERLGGELHVLHACSLAERRRSEAVVAAVVAPHAVPQSRIHVLHGSPVSVLPDAASALRADVVVMGAVSRSRIEEMFVGHTAERTLDLVASDILVIKLLEFMKDLPF
jgi:universal stress protein E